MKHQRLETQTMLVLSPEGNRVFPWVHLAPDLQMESLCAAVEGQTGCGVSLLNGCLCSSVNRAPHCTYQTVCTGFSLGWWHFDKCNKTFSAFSVDETVLCSVSLRSQGLSSHLYIHSERYLWRYFTSSFSFFVLAC